MSLVLLPDAKLTALKAAASANTPQWVAFKARLDANLPKILSLESYQGSQLSWIADYSLGYQITGKTDYADKAIALIKQGMREYQEGGWETRQFLARGDGTTKTFTVPNADFIPASLKVYIGAVMVRANVRGTPNTPDVINDGALILNVSNSSDGPADYVSPADWIKNPNLGRDFIDWSPAGKEPAQGATYYVTEARSWDATEVAYTLAGTNFTLATAPTVNQAVYVEYVYGTHAADGSTLAYQQTTNHDGGFNSIFVDTTYTSRYLGKFIGIGLDWLFDYVGLTSALKAEAVDLLVRWSDYVRDNGYYKNSPASNYGAGGYVSRMVTAIVLSNRGDPNGPRLVSEMTAYRNTYLIPALTNPDASVKGGFWAEGWNYGELAAENVLLAGLAFEQAGLGAATVERQWAGDVVNQLVAGQPTPTTTYDGGDGFAYPAPFPGKGLFYVLSATASDATAQGYANYIIQKYAGDQAANHLDLLYRDPAAETATWTNTPLQNRAIGTGLVVARADWSYQSTFVSLQLGNFLSADHQSFTPGQLQINRGGDALLVNAPAVFEYQQPDKSKYGNIVAIDDNGDGAQVYRWSMGTWYGSPGCVTTAYEATADRVYVAGDYKAAYSLNTNPGGGGSATTLTRQVVYLRPDLVIVHDRVGTLKPEYPKRLQWHHLNSATVTGNSWVATAGGSKLFGQTFSPVPIATVNEAVTDSKTVYRVSSQPVSPISNLTYTTVLQSAPASATAPLPVSWSVVNGNSVVTVGKQTVTFGTDGKTATIGGGSGMASMFNNQMITAHVTPNQGVLANVAWTVDNPALVDPFPSGNSCTFKGKNVDGTVTITVNATDANGTKLPPQTGQLVIGDAPVLATSMALTFDAPVPRA